MGEKSFVFGSKEGQIVKEALGTCKCLGVGMISFWASRLRTGPLQLNNITLLFVFQGSSSSFT
jgi:hypothetical protein